MMSEPWETTGFRRLESEPSRTRRISTRPPGRKEISRQPNLLVYQPKDSSRHTRQAQSLRPHSTHQAQNSLLNHFQLYLQHLPLPRSLTAPFRYSTAIECDHNAEPGASPLTSCPP